MNVFSDLGLMEGRIYEAIVSTYMPDNTPTASPMGITVSGDQLRIRPFKTSTLLLGLQHSRCGVVNFTLDPYLFYITAFKEKNPNGRVPRGLFEPARSVKAPRIKSSSLYLEFKVVELIAENERVQVCCQVTHGEAAANTPNPYCRGLFASIECIIHATRIREYIQEKRFDEVKKLLLLIKHYRGLIDRVSPSSVYSQIVDDVMRDVKRWRMTL
ncbi:MAG: DUF447 family protein [Candidatus Bathyarchaeia archaeon]